MSGPGDAPDTPEVLRARVAALQSPQMFQSLPPQQTHFSVATTSASRHPDNPDNLQLRTACNTQVPWMQPKVAGTPMHTYAERIEDTADWMNGATSHWHFDITRGYTLGDHWRVAKLDEEVGFVLKDDVTPSVAFDRLLEPRLDVNIECALALHLLLAYWLKRAVGAVAFDRAMRVGPCFLPLKTVDVGQSLARAVRCNSIVCLEAMDIDAQIEAIRQRPTRYHIAYVRGCAGFLCMTPEESQGCSVYQGENVIVVNPGGDELPFVIGRLREPSADGGHTSVSAYRRKSLHEVVRSLRRSGRPHVRRMAAHTRHLPARFFQGREPREGTLSDCVGIVALMELGVVV